MPFYVKDSGTWKEVTSGNYYVKHGGAWTVVQEAYVKDAGSWKQYFQGEVNVTLANSTNVAASSLFTSSVWTGTTPKRITVPSGVTIGGTGGTAAITIASNMAGTLIIDNAGSILDTGGASNGGAGGNAITNAASNVTINNTNLLAGGGGGGGQGGAGGAGEVDGGREPASNFSNGSQINPGYYWNVNSYHIYYDGATSYVYWGSNIGSASGFPSYVRIGSNEYHRGASRGGGKYEIYRQAKTTTSAGTGGAGGLGQGYNQTNSSGSSGSAGGTNAGTGGAGGAGSTYAVAGVAGSTGANGNAVSGGTGSAGSAGGAAGAAVSGTSVTMNNTGTVHGAVA